MRSIPEFVLGVLTAVALIALGAVIWPNYQPSQHPTAYQANQSTYAGEPWLTKDAAGFFAFWLVLVGAGQLALFAWQLRLIRDSLDDARIAAEAAKESADAARISADGLIAVEGARLLIHPIKHNYWEVAGEFVSTGLDSSSIGKLSGGIVASFCLKNYGKTPATIVKLVAKLAFSTEPPPNRSPPPTRKVRPAALRFEAVVPANEMTETIESYMIGGELTRENVIAIKKSEAAIWLWGFVVYWDVFDRECEQRFAFMLDNTRSGRFIRHYDNTYYRHKRNSGSRK